MSSSTTAGNPSKSLSNDLSQASQTALPPSNNNRSSFLASLLSMSSPTTSQPHPRHNSLSSSTCSSTTSVSPSLSSLATYNDHSSGSPTSSIASPRASEHSPIGYSKPNISPASSYSRQASLSESFSSLASSFGWPASAGAPNVEPISIPNCAPGFPVNDHDASSLTRSSAPTRRTSIGAPTFRRAFELPNYSNLYSLRGDPQESSGSVDTTRRGRSGSLFSSFGVGDASKRTSGPPRRKLSPMGERMIRDHPF